MFFFKDITLAAPRALTEAIKKLCGSNNNYCSFNNSHCIINHSSCII